MTVIPFNLDKANTFLNNLFGNILPHFGKIKDSINQGALDQMAHQFIQTNDLGVRQAYLLMKQRVDTIHKICQAMLEDAGTDAVVRGKIVELFPDFNTAAKDQVVLVDNTNPAIPTSDSSILGQPVVAKAA